MQQSFLTVKLHELEKQQGKLQTGIRVCQKEKAEEIEEKVNELKAECEAEDILLEQNVKTAHSKAVRALSNAQLAYDEKLAEIKDKILPECIREGTSFCEDKAESAMLYAEFSIDFALRASKNALQDALTAIAMEKECEERRKNDE